MLNWAHFPLALRQLLWAQCAHHATQLENIICKQNSNTASELFYGKKPPWIKYLKQIGEIGIVHDHKKIHGNISDQGFPCVFIGYSSNHAPNVYKFLTIKKETMIQSRNIIWLNLNYEDYMEKHMSHKATRDFTDMDKYDFCSMYPDELVDYYQDLGKEYDYDQNFLEDEHEIEEIDDIPNEDLEDDKENENNDIVQVIPTASPRLSGVQREIRNLTTFYNNTDPGDTEETALLARVFNPTRLT
jgi:hypothetical protein